MTINELKNIAGDCKTTSRWASVDGKTLRIVTVGRTAVRLMAGSGSIITVAPADVQKAW